MDKLPLPATSDDQRGVILIIVLWTVAMMTVVIAALSTNVRTSASLAGTEMRRLKTEMLLEGGIDVAAAAIMASGDGMRALVDGHATQIDLGNGNIAEMKIRDASGMVDINRADNALVANIISRVTESADIGKATAELIAKWRNSELDAAEDTEPAAFTSVAQLYNIQDIDRQAVAKLLPYVSLYSKDGLVNLTAAPDEVINSIPDATPVQIDALFGAKSRNDWENNDIKDVLDDLSDYVTLDPTNVFIVDLQLLQASGLIAGTHLQATIMVDKTADVPFHVLSRSW
jgi:general secretion pathway protein K